MSTQILEKEKTINGNLIVNIKFLYYVMVIVPYVGITAAIITYVTIGKTKYPYIPTVSECMVDFPITHIFGPVLSVESALLVCYGLIRDHISGYLVSTKFVSRRKYPTIARYCLKVLLSIGIIGLFMLANCNRDLSFPIHNASAILFFSSIAIYHVVDDFLFSYLDIPPTNLGRIISWFTVAILFFFPIFRNANPNNKTFLSIASICEYIGIFLFPIKVFLNGIRLPFHCLTFSLKYNDNSVSSNPLSSPSLGPYTSLPNDSD